MPEHPDFLRSWHSRSENYRLNTNASLNIRYGHSDRELLDVFPVPAKLAPVHVFIHGGYWQALNKDSFSFFAEYVNRNDECGVVLNYGLCPTITMATIVDQIYAAMNWVLENIHRFGGDPGRIQVTGHSAGAHLLAKLLTGNWSLQSGSKSPFHRFNALSGIYDLQPLVDTSVNHALALDQKSAEALSPLFEDPRKPSASTSLNLYVGDLESTEYKNQSERLLNAWKNKFPIYFQLIPNSHHFSILDDFLTSCYQPWSPATK